MGIDFTYHPQLYITHSSWIDGILPIITLLIRSFRLQYIFLISYRDVTNLCPLACLCLILTATDTAWNVSIHTLSYSSAGDSISCFRSLLYLSPHNVLSSASFNVSSPLSYPSSFY